jgi:protease-4
MGDYAASGGYYIACNASMIIAQPNTLTGSIGIFGMFPNMEGLTKKVGLSYDNVKTNKMADFGDATRPMREDEKAVVQNYIEHGYDLFLTRCSEGRGISKDSLDSIAQGRVWTGTQALKIGLVDALGGLNTAIAEAAKLADLEDYSLRGFPKKQDFWSNLFSNQKEEMATRVLKEYLGSDYQLFKTIKEIKEQDFIQARMPYDIDVR